MVLQDGGVFENNPAKLLFDKAIEEGYKKEDIVIVSLGTGELKNEKEKNAVSHMYWGSKDVGTGIIR